MYIELFKARKSLYDMMKLKNYIVMDLEYANTGTGGKGQAIINISAVYFKNNNPIKEYNVWKMPANATNKAIDQACINKHQISTELKSKNESEYNNMFIGFYDWIKNNSLTKTPIIGCGIQTDISEMNLFFEKHITTNESSRAMFEYDLQKSFVEHIKLSSLSLDVATNLLGIDRQNVHIGKEDVRTINEVKNKMKILVDTFGL